MAFKLKKDGILKKDKIIGNDRLIDELCKQHPIIADHHLHWVFLYAMYLGKQYAFPDYMTGKLTDASELENTLAQEIIIRNTRSIYNMYAGFLDTYIAKMLKDNPVPQVYPTSFDNDMIKAARIGNIALEDWWRKEQVEAKIYEAVMWSAITGTGILKVYFNKDKGVPISVGDGIMKEGEIVCNSVPPWLFFPDPMAKNMESARFVEEIYIQPLSNLKNVLDKEITDGLSSEKDAEDYRSMLSAYTNESAGYAKSDEILAEESILVKEYWERAVEGYDAGAGVGKGLLKLRAGGKTLYEGPNPQGKDLPYFRMVAKGRPDSFWGQGHADGIVQPQIDFNRINSQTMENIDWLGNTKIAVPYSFDETLYNKDAGGLLQCDMADGIPTQIKIQPFESQVMNFAESIIQRMMHIIGLHEVSFAQLPERASRISGKALDMLIDSETVRFAKDMNSFKTVLEDVAFRFVKLARDNYDIEKYVSMVGKYRGLEIEAFKGKDLRVERGEFGFFAEVGKGFGLSPARKAEQLSMLWDRGIIQDPQEILKNLEFGTVDKIYYDATLDENKAQRHLDMIVSGVEGEEVAVAPPISKFDNHKVFIKVFTDFVRRPEYDTLSEDQRKAIEAALERHMQLLQEIMMQQQMMMPPRQQQGAPPGQPMQEPSEFQGEQQGEF